MVINRRAGIVIVVACLAFLTLQGCGIRHRLFGGSVPTRRGTLTVTPTNGPAGTKFSLVAGGFLPGEAMTFEIDVPGHRPFIGPPHSAGTDGTVASSYMSQSADPPGTYQLKAVGARGTRATATVTVTAASAP